LFFTNPTKSNDLAVQIDENIDTCTWNLLVCFLFGSETGRLVRFSVLHPPSPPPSLLLVEVVDIDNKIKYSKIILNREEFISFLMQPVRIWCRGYCIELIFDTGNYSPADSRYRIFSGRVYTLSPLYIARDRPTDHQPESEFAGKPFG
jgi:hypothetical protein